MSLGRQFNKNILYFLVSILFYFPIIAFYGYYHFGILNHNANFNDDLPTGFLKGDMPYYMSNARSYLCNDSFSFFYKNPFTTIEKTGNIYFHLHIFIFSLFLRLGIDPGVVFLVFGVVSGIAFLFLSLKLFDKLIGLDKFWKYLMVLFFVWGGGLLGFANILDAKIKEGVFYNSPQHYFDPSQGWWLINFGRNLIFPTEAFYHALVVLVLLLLVSKKYKWMLFVVFLLSLSHPFTGIEFAIITLVWVFFEYTFFIDKKEVSLVHLFLALLIVLEHLAYNLYLSQDPVHKKLIGIWSLPWFYNATAFVPALILVVFTTYLSYRNINLFKKLIVNPFNRYLWISAFITFLLSNHEFAIPPKQPIHFDHGYIWMSLFLLGLPFLIELFLFIEEKANNSMIKYLIVTSITLLYLSDNILWFISQQGNKVGMFMHNEDRGLLHFINSKLPKNSIILGRPDNFNYYITTYTSSKSACNHWYNNPSRQENEMLMDSLFKNCTLPIKWHNYNYYIVEDTKDTVFNHNCNLDKLNLSLIYKDNRYRLFYRVK